MRRTFLVFVLAASVLSAQEKIPVFEPMQPELLGAGSTFTNAFADFDGDGDPDMFVGFDGKPNRLYRNDKGTFTDVAAAAGVVDSRPTRAAAWGDFDSDGDPDLLLGFTPSTNTSVLKLYRNTAGKFTDTTTDVGLAVPTGAVRQPAWIDVDADGDLDLFIAYRDRPNALYRNDAGKFTDVAPALGLADPRRTVGAVWFDFDEDGDLDVAVANMDGDANGLFRNDGGTFTDVADAAGVAWGGRAPKAAGQRDRARVRGRRRQRRPLRSVCRQLRSAGLLQQPRQRRVRGSLGGVEHRRSTHATTRARSPTVDHDGRLDLYVNGTVTGGASWQDSLFRNTGSAFVDVTPPSIRRLQADHGVQWVDADGDHDLDLALTGARADGTHLVMRNMLAAADAGAGPAREGGRCAGAVDARRRRSAGVCRRHDAAGRRAAGRQRVGLRRAKRRAGARRRAGRRRARRCAGDRAAPGHAHRRPGSAA